MEPPGSFACAILNNKNNSNSFSYVGNKTTSGFTVNLHVEVQELYTPQ